MTTPNLEPADSLMIGTAASCKPARACSDGAECVQVVTYKTCYSMQLRSQQLQLAIKPSTVWRPEDLSQLSSLVASRNRFVCMQLVTMVKEQHSKVTTAKAAGDSSVLHQAMFVFLGTITTQAADTEAPNVVSAGLFYPRLCSKDGAQMPHVYVELLCCNSPGLGYGSLLLSHIEQFAAADAGHLSAAFAGCTATSTNAVSSIQPVSGGGLKTVELTATAAAAGMVIVPAESPAPLMLPLVADGEAVPADLLSSCCNACSKSADGSASMASSDSMQLTGSAELSCVSSAASTATATASSTHQTQAELQLMHVISFASALEVDAAGTATLSAAVKAAGDITAASVVPAAAAAAAAASPAARRICGVKLLSVESARSFYERHGYGQPDASREMFKALPLLPTRGAIGSASSSSICSMMSDSSSSSTMVC